MTTVLAVAVSVLPVFVFLGALVLIDSYKLVRLRAILLSVAAGMAAGLVAWGANDSGQSQVPAGLSNVVAVAGGGRAHGGPHSVLMRPPSTTKFEPVTLPARGDASMIRAGAEQAEISACFILKDNSDLI